MIDRKKLNTMHFTSQGKILAQVEFYKFSRKEKRRSNFTVTECVS